MDPKLQNPLDLDIYTWENKKRFKVQSLVRFGFWVVELLLITHLLLELFAPYTASSLKSVMDSITGYLLSPLFVAFGISPTSEPISERVTLFAIIFYWLLVTGILSFFRGSKKVSQIEIARAHSKRKYGY